MPKDSDITELTHLARFVFKGTVLKIKGATMKDVPVNNRTVIVRVDAIIQAPEALSEVTGSEITVQLGGRKKVKKGDQSIFYTNGWLFGDGVAVQSIDTQAAEGMPLAFAAAVEGDPVENLADTVAQARFESADLVVTGRVVSVKLPPERAGFALAAAEDATTLSKPISEHDPQTQEAEIEVDAVHKGTNPGGAARIRFPNSRDVKWYKAPKFRAGQEGVYMLHKDEAKKAPQRAREGVIAAAGVASDMEEEAYTALHPADFQPADQPGGSMKIIAALASTIKPQPE